MINFVLHEKSVHVSFMALLLPEPANEIVCKRSREAGSIGCVSQIEFFHKY